MSEKQLNLRFHGAAGTVTGSCMEFSLGQSRVLVDCGMFQGSRSLEHLNIDDFAFDPSQIDAVILTHAHIDHSGMLPKLVKGGFTGPIWCTLPTSDLLEHMLADSGRIQEYEAERRNRRRDRAGEEPFVPVYTSSDAMEAWQQCRPIQLEEAFEPAPGFHARLWNAGHILGSASVELNAGGVRVICSGDLGPENKAFHLDPEGPSGFDFVVCEATYGDRQRERVTIAERRKLLQSEVEAAITRGGNLVIPAFALERTQELLLDLHHLMCSGAIPDVSVFIDSPLANRVTEVFERHASELEDTGKVNIFDHPSFHFVTDVSQSISLNSVSGAVILAASGMCEGGRIRHHLIHNLHRRDSTVLFVGFQAQGTLGRVIMEGAERVRISGNDVRVRAQIRRIDSYSAHADQTELLDWIDERSPISGSLFLDHGEPSALEAMRRELQRRNPGLNVRLPQIGELYALAPKEQAARLETGRTDLAEALGRDWQNTYADFATSLKAELAKLRSDRQREEALTKMRHVLETYNAHMASRNGKSGE
ncbi:metallo-beta-lactamase family protein [Altererythrobacter xiamenensis]|uniref:Metallo-beta-lactamase family protein n=1 Tax=Altererythrobacter xiamenensis TaxID=1316679 RepID=A0A1Y6FFC9_9SPHN|nr:MBL fold metallo-hydrolase [Altererythrobacter xiamenensis]SMQ73668.1 metallo-beta-lactamase family protein [Altererythrobacter xiamenensis]